MAQVETLAGVVEVRRLFGGELVGPRRQQRQLEARQPQPQAGVVLAVPGQERFVLGAPAPVARGGVVAREVQLARSDAGQLEVGPQRTVRSAQHVAEPGVAVHDLHGGVEPRGRLPGSFEHLREVPRLRGPGVERREDAAHLVQPREHRKSVQPEAGQDLVHLAQRHARGEPVEVALGVVVDVLPQRHHPVADDEGSGGRPGSGDRRPLVGEVRGDGDLAAYDVLLGRRHDPGHHGAGTQVQDGGPELAQHDGVARVEPEVGGHERAAARDPDDTRPSSTRVARDGSLSAMSRRLRDLATFANVASMLALVVALSGSAYAVGLAEDSVGARQIKKNAVRSAEVKNHSLKKKDFKAGQLPAGPRGPAGPQGPQGPAGATSVVYRHSSTESIPEDGYAFMSASCQAGERLVGGGGGFNDVTSNYSFFAELAVSAPGILVGDYPNHVRPLQLGELPNAWYVGGQQVGAPSAVLTAYAVCAPL